MRGKAAVWLAVVALGCGAEGADGGSGSDDTEAVTETQDPQDEVDRDAVRACLLVDWFDRTCTGCHFAGGDLDLTRDPLGALRGASWTLDPSVALVVPGDPDASFLVRKLAANPGLVTLEATEGGPMPLDRTIDAEDVQLVADWVASGAPDCD